MYVTMERNFNHEDKSALGSFSANPSGSLALGKFEGYLKHIQNHIREPKLIDICF